MKKKFLSLLAMCLTLVLVLASCAKAPTTTTTEPTNAPKADASKTIVGFVYIGSKDDKGWSYAHEQARLKLVEKLGVTALYKENVSDADDSCIKAIEDMIDGGASIIFATSYGYMDYVVELAAKHKDVKFYHCSGYKTAENLSTYFGRMYQARYLSGIAAGLKTKTNNIGYVAAYPIPEVVRGINAFTLGVRSVNPTAVVHVTWTSTWYDPTKEKDAADALFRQFDIDVMAQHQDTPMPQIAAEEHNAFAIGYNVETKESAPKAFITAPVWDWSPYYIQEVTACMEGKYKSTQFWEGLSNGIVGLSPLTELAAPGTQEKIDAAKEQILSGKWDVFDGPIKDQSGVEKVPAGSSVSDADKLSINWFVEGVDGKIE